MTRHLALAALTTAAALGLSLASGPAARPALLGAGIAAATAFASLISFGLLSRSPRQPLQKALAVFVVMFMVRLVAVALGVVAAARAGWSLTAFVVAFFVPYFVFVAIEGGLLHALSRSPGRTA